jgi:hypothetical protein
MRAGNMIVFDKTQPVRDRSAPRLDFGGGVYAQHVMGTTYAWVTQGGTHLAFVEAQHVEYESTLTAEYLKARSFAQ